MGNFEGSEIAWVEARLRARAVSTPSGEEGGRGTIKPPIPAAVLIALIERGDALAIVLTRRAADLNDHAGEICFPGGRLDPGETDPVAAALRETQEEIALDPRQARILGLLAPYFTGSGFVVTPVVAAIASDARFVPAAREVAAVIEVPLRFVLAGDNLRRESRVIAGARRSFYVLRHEGHEVWGATAGMLAELRRVLLEE